ncbi:hypothetical protein FRX31_028693 [Thalictrum thalictroides]|uniref:Myb/SANT-like domain-containing protein n=1 Tax=Thalictrum thalictroides TaxID=46969 RepID=A0A7J6VBX2_THATH|nr:hypothetical protein FRX31_028693 [Thalictrum thalictroides]
MDDPGNDLKDKLSDESSSDEEDDGNGNGMTTIPERRNIMWTPEMDSILIRFLYDKAVSGNKRCDNGWKPASLKHVGELVGGVYGSPLLPKNVRDMTNGSNHLEALDDTETNIEFLHRNLIDEIDDTGDEGMPFPPVTEPFTPTDGEGFLSDLGMGDGSSGAKLRRRRGSGSNDPTKRSRSRFSNGEDPEIKQSFVTLAQATKDIAQSFQSPDYVKLGEIMSQIEDLYEEDAYAAMDVFSTQKESANVILGLSAASRPGWLHKKIGWNYSEN